MYRKLEQISALPPSVAKATMDLLRLHQRSVWKRTDRLLAWLLVVEWIGCIAVAICRSPLTWAGTHSSIHPHVWSAIVFGLLIMTLPVYLAIYHASDVLTRHTIAIGQMLMSALLIHVGDGRVETHFHIFGSLAFIAFYRDWRVLMTATVVITLDHLLRGIYLPVSVYGVMSASIWRTVEHAWWVAFEDVFLIGACIQSVREMSGIAIHRALLEASYQNVESQVTERTAQLKSTQEDLMKAARSAGMAEIATSVLHNVGNVLNSVNISAMIVNDKLRESEVASLQKVSAMMDEHQTDMASYLTDDERGKMIPGFICDLANCLGQEQTDVLGELQNLTRGIEHIKQIVASQQSMAKKSNIASKVQPASLIDTAISIQGVNKSSGIEIERQIDPVPEVTLDQHKVLQILINLISNATQAVAVRPMGARKITIRLQSVTEAGHARLRFAIADNGMGIAADHLTRIFSHGFTTKKDGHGFGLHSAANAAREMSGSLSAASDGPGKGATFTLDIPVVFVQEEQLCKS